ncbi:MAG: Ribose operon repressor [Chloroflexi bacterium AL-W]|nr:Ribose operon repressor [Chloroflexi bacterium AL-N1]NOK69401.1 Ribose operon repressor [Chloroflexi bacterium AL-N10]NOK76462.1 Ribose operon repressor [Chloroflexi bacterium AL-N5]NOK83579.1 Ribose operon repressor [Chloroflexi bacterium AL-W]NOK91239.1 Ribose operon repressor [Chloroflexi bacterium AL-N15]
MLMSTSLTIEQIAEIANVSRSTVSRVLNNHPSVRQQVRDRVLQVIQKYNYTPQAAARSLASSRTDVIGLLIPRSAAFIFDDPFFPNIIQGISEACLTYGYFLMLSMLTADMEQSFYNRILRGRHFDGVIMLSSDIDDPLLPLLIKDRVPLVLIGSHPYFQDVNSVDVANREGAYHAVKHLVALGHQRIATVTGSLQMSAAQDRLNGYKQALLESNIGIAPNLIVEGHFTQEGAYHATRELLTLANSPTALFTASDTMAIGALHAIHEAQLKVPDDIALVSFDDLPSSLYTTPPLTTMHQPIAEMGTSAVDILIKNLKHPADHTPQAVRLPTSLVIRDSCGANTHKTIYERS